MKVKSKKSILKRFKFTKTGKILRRATGQDHYGTKKTGKQKRKMRKWISLSPAETRQVKKILIG